MRIKAYSGRKTQTEEQNPQPGGADIKFLLCVLFLAGIGIVMVYSASSTIASEKFGSGYFFLRKQAFFFMLGVIVLAAARYFPLKLLHGLAYPLLALSFVFLVAVHISGLGVSAGGAVRWLSIGGITFQPAEFARFAMILFLAYSMTKKQDKLEDFYIGFLPHVLILSIFVLPILLQPDFGSVVILGAITWMMMFVAGVRISHLVLSLMVSIPILIAFLVSSNYRLQRIIAFWDPWEHASDGGYQIIHSLMAFGSGGIWGAGVGKSYQKLFYLPEPHTDFIFSIIGEEFGLVGVLFIIGMYVLIIWKGIRISMTTEDFFTCLLAMGLTAGIAIQVCVNMGVTLGLLPTKGLTLPFLSYGGTSLLLNMGAVGILMNISVNRETVVSEK